MKDFGTAAAETIMRAAIEWWKTNVSPTIDDAAAHELVKQIKLHVKQALDEGLRDSKEALDAGMSQAAVATFTASIKLGGYRAADAAAKALGRTVTR